MVLLLAWEGVCRLGWVDPILLAAPSDILKAAWPVPPRLRDAFLLTAFEIVVSAGIAIVLGLCVGLLVGSQPLLKEALVPFLDAGNAVPKIMWYPLLVITMGLGAQSKIAYGVLAGFLPVALVTIDAIQAVDAQLVRAARSFGATRVQTILRVMLPMALPGIIAGLRIGITLVSIGIVVAEMLASFNGLGFWISYHRTTFDAPQIYLGILLSLVLTLALSSALAAIERRAGRWRETPPENNRP
ncbi:MAG: ABC transporter permease [Lautropia sp.]